MTGINKYGKDINMEFEKLDNSNQHLLSTFYCDNESIKKYFTKEAINDTSSSTYIFINKDADDVIAVLTISCTGVVDISNPVYRDMISAIEINYFATSEKYQKLSYSENWNDGTLSHQLFSYGIKYIKRVPYSHCAAAMIVLYSVPDAIDFYKRAGFRLYLDFMEEKNIPYLEGCTPMYINMP